MTVLSGVITGALAAGLFGGIGLVAGLALTRWVYIQFQRRAVTRAAPGWIILFGTWGSVTVAGSVFLKTLILVGGFHVADALTARARQTWRPHEQFRWVWTMPEGMRSVWHDVADLTATPTAVVRTVAMVVVGDWGTVVEVGRVVLMGAAQHHAARTSEGAPPMVGPPSALVEAAWDPRTRPGRAVRDPALRALRQWRESAHAAVTTSSAGVAFVPLTSWPAVWGRSREGVSVIVSRSVLKAVGFSLLWLAMYAVVAASALRWDSRRARKLDPLHWRTGRATPRAEAEQLWANRRVRESGPTPPRSPHLTIDPRLRVPAGPPPAPVDGAAEPPSFADDDGRPEGRH
jgi:hypothetical protein